MTRGRRRQKTRAKKIKIIRPETYKKWAQQKRNVRREVMVRVQAEDVAMSGAGRLVVVPVRTTDREFTGRSLRTEP